MNDVTLKNGLRFIGLLFLQIVILQRINFNIGDFQFIHMIVYPFAIFLMPVTSPKALVLTLAFIVGLLVDFFYNTPGLNATAMLITAYLRPLVLRFLTPYDGYTNKTSPTLIQMGFGWFVAYISLMMLIFCFIFYSVDAFTFVFFYKIFLNAIFTLIPSLLTFFIIHVLFRPKV